MELGLCLYYMRENKLSERKKMFERSYHADSKKVFHERKKNI